MDTQLERELTYRDAIGCERLTVPELNEPDSGRLVTDLIGLWIAGARRAT